MAAGRLDLVVDQGATFTMSLVYKDGTTPVDLTGASCRMQARRRHGSAVTILDIVPAIADPATGGRIDITLSAATTTALPIGRHVYDLEIVFTDGTVERLVEGEFKVKPEVTR